MKKYTIKKTIDIAKKFKEDTQFFSNSLFAKKYKKTLTVAEMEEKWFQENLINRDYIIRKPKIPKS